MTIFIVGNLYLSAASQASAASLEGSISEPSESQVDNPVIAPPLIGSDLVKRLQTALRALKLYKGDITGKVDDLTERAIREYQRRKGLKETGIVDNALVGQMEMAINIDLLLGQLAVARKARKDNARTALLSHPATRDLIEDSLRNETANAARDPSTCFANPTVRCLLNEALESAKAVPRAEMRNWAFGELLVAQARAGLGDQARETARRISDPRLIISALGQIAEAQALSGRDDEAISAAEIIPDVEERIDAYAMIAQISARGGRSLGATAAVAHLRQDTRSLDSDSQQIAYLAQGSIILHRLGFERDAKVLLASLEQQAENLELPAHQDSARRHVARSLAVNGDIESATRISARITSEDERTPVEISIAETQISAGQYDAAIVTAQSIGAVRFQTVVLATIARALIVNNQREKALQILRVANEQKNTIKFPFAKDYAGSRIALAYAMMATAKTPPDTTMFAKAMHAADEIKDERLKAETIWRIAFTLFGTGADEFAQAKNKALEETEKIISVPTQAWLLAELAENRALAGQDDWAQELFDQSLEKSAGVRNPWSRARTLSRLAQSLIHIVEHTTEPDNEAAIEP